MSTADKSGQATRAERRGKMFKIIERAGGMPARAEVKAALESLSQWLRGEGEDARLQQGEDVSYAATIAMGTQNPRKISVPADPRGEDTSKRRLLGWGKFIEELQKHPGPWSQGGLQTLLSSSAGRQLAELLGEATVPAQAMRVKLHIDDAERVYADGRVHSCMTNNNDSRHPTEHYSASPSAGVLAVRRSDGTLVARSVIWRGFDRNGKPCVQHDVVYNDGSDRSGRAAQMVGRAAALLAEGMGGAPGMPELVLMSESGELSRDLPYLDHMCMVLQEDMSLGQKGAYTLLTHSGSALNKLLPSNNAYSPEERQQMQEHAERILSLGEWPTLPDGLRYDGPWDPDDEENQADQAAQAAD